MQHPAKNALATPAM